MDKSRNHLNNWTWPISFADAHITGLKFLVILSSILITYEEVNCKVLQLMQSFSIMLSQCENIKRPQLNECSFDKLNVFVKHLIYFFSNWSFCLL